MKIIKIIFFIFWIITHLNYATANDNFEEWKTTFKKFAIEQGVSSKTLNEHINKSKDAIKLSFLKVLAAMLNGYGGTIRVGVADSGEVIGLLGDWEDMSSNGKKTLAEARGRYENWVSGSLISDNLGKEVFGYIFKVFYWSRKMT